jgi:Flp pilus assembly secretin CpaC
MMGLVEHAHRRRRIVLLAALAMLAGVSASGRVVAAGFTVAVDQAKVVKIPERTSTVVIGNPLIADISVQAGGTIVVTGKGYGVTNFIALDNRGNTLMDETIEVRGPNENVVTMYRGVERESYSCTPKCERRITLGDSPAYFDATLQQTGRRDGQAISGAVNNPRER